MESMAERQAPSPWRRFLASLSLVILLFIAALFSGIYVNGQRAIESELKGQARTLFDSIVLTRKWNAEHGGVFVEKTPGMQSNPYLKNPDIEPADGRAYTKKNPALMTREISEIAEKQGVFRFHITSLKPMNPKNAPDDFERRALESFEQGTEEASGRRTSDGSIYYRYIAPLITERACLTCHGEQGYRIGDVRGGIGVEFDINATERAMVRNRFLVVGSFVATLLAFLAIVHRLVFTLQKKLEAAEARIRKMAVTDELTNLKNRRFVLARLSEELERARRYQRALSCLILDVDHFKRVNDAYGHDAGDAVLKAVSVAVQGRCRDADTVGRYGGEEFMAVLPETDGKRARHVAERIRQTIEELRVTTSTGEEITVTASLGVADLSPNGEVDGVDAGALIKRADDALYRAKEAGRNRVEVATPDGCGDLENMQRSQ